MLSTRSGREACRNVLAPILAKGVETALVGPDDVPPLILLLRDGVEVAQRGGYSPFTEYLPGLLSAEAAAIIHYGCINIVNASILVADIEPSRDFAFDVQDLPDGAEEITKFIYEQTTIYCMYELMALEVPRAELYASARLLAYSGLFESVSVFPPATEPFYLVAR